MELFKRGPSLGYRLFLLVLLSIFIMVLDHRDSHTDKLRSALSIVVAPIQYIVHWPIQMTDWIQTHVSSHHRLLKDNQKLRAEQLLLQAQVQKYQALETENDRLRALLQSSPRDTEKVEIARLLAVDSNPFVQQFTLGKGSKDDVYVGQPVLDAKGVLGQVIEVGPITSQVLLLTDTRSSIPVEDSRSGIRGVVNGLGSVGKLSLVHIPKTADISEGDVMVTSGLGRRFPVGFPVGVVTHVENSPGEHFAIIEVRPSAEFNRSRLVLLVWSRDKYA